MLRVAPRQIGTERHLGGGLGLVDTRSRGRVCSGRKDSEQKTRRNPTPPIVCRRFSHVSSAHSPASHIRIVGSAASLRYDPIDILLRILDVAGFTMNAILRVYL